MRRLDLDLETNEFDNFISKKGMSGMLKGITAQLGACLTEVSGENPEFAQEKLKGLSKSENARYQALMKACLESKKKKPPVRVHKNVSATDYQKMRENKMPEEKIQKYKMAEQKRLDNLQVFTKLLKRGCKKRIWTQEGLGGKVHSTITLLKLVQKGWMILRFSDKWR